MKDFFKKPVVIAIITVIIVVAIILFVEKDAIAAKLKLGFVGGNAVSSYGPGGTQKGVQNDTKYPYSYTNSAKTYKMTSGCVKKLQERILKVYSTYHGNTTYPNLYDAAVAMKNAGGADGKLGAKTKAAFDACNFPTLLANSGAKLDTDYIIA